MTTASESFPAGIDLDDSLEVLQQNVQLHLGRCMLRLQQYERRLKTMVAHMTIEGPLEQLPSLRAQQEADASGKTLGTLIKMFNGSHLTPAVPEGDNPQYDEVKGDGASGDAAWARMHFNIAMSPELYAQTRAGLAELVSLRNDLVHHLIDRFNISDKSGCRNAAQHLKAAISRLMGTSSNCRIGPQASPMRMPCRCPFFIQVSSKIWLSMVSTRTVQCLGNEVQLSNACARLKLLAKWLVGHLSMKR